MDNNQNSPNDPSLPPVPSPIQPVPVQSGSDSSPTNLPVNPPPTAPLPWMTPTSPPAPGLNDTFFNPPAADNPPAGTGPVPAPTPNLVLPPLPTTDQSAVPETTTSSFFNAPTQPGLDNALSSWQPTPVPTDLTTSAANPSSTIPSFDVSPQMNSVASPSPAPATTSFPSAEPTPPNPPPSWDTPPASSSPLGENPAPSPDQITQGWDVSSSTAATGAGPAMPTWPPIDQVTPPQPTTLPPFEQSQMTPPPTSAPIAGSVNPLGGSTSLPEPAPTDLSQLTSTSGNIPPVPTESYAPEHTNPITTASNTTAASTPETVTAPKPFPFQLLIGGVVTLLLVTAASIYIFFFAGKNAPEPSSLPAEQTQLPLSNPPKQAVPSIVPQEATSGAGFGSLNNQLATASAKPLSALDALRQRQASPAP